MSNDLPTLGSTLRLYGHPRLDAVDPASVWYPGTDQITRLYARRLLAYPALADLRNWQAIAPVPDLATSIPSTYNTGMGARHLNYVVHLRPGVLWDTIPPRQVTSQDVVRGLKRLCNPVHRPAALPYFTSTIRGMREYCENYAASVPVRPSAADLAAYQDAHDIPGVLILDDESLVIELEQPALDFITILALPCAAPAPAEYDAFIPGSPGLCGNIRSNGPYRVSRYVPGKELCLEQNPVWDQDADPIRHRYVEAISVTMEQASPRKIADEIGAGLADLPWGCPVANRDSRAGGASDDDLGYSLDPYLVFNVGSTNASAALGKVAVRQALSYAINKRAIASIVRELNPGAVIQTAGSIIPPGNDGHQEINLYATPDDHGDPARCRALLEAAGYRDGLTLTALLPDDEAHIRIARSCAADLNSAGVTLRFEVLPYADYLRTMRNPQRSDPAWDCAVGSWQPDWFYLNDRVFLQPMFQASPLRGPGNYGGYSNSEVDKLIGLALAAFDEPVRAKAAWQEAERRILEDAAIVPILFQKPASPGVRAAHVRNAIAMPAANYTVDLSNVRLASTE